jgi:hypothetical protein
MSIQCFFSRCPSYRIMQIEEQVATALLSTHVRAIYLADYGFSSIGRFAVLLAKNTSVMP